VAGAETDRHEQYINSSCGILPQLFFTGLTPNPMADYVPSTYGDRIADVYDSWPGTPTDTEQAVSFLAGLAGGGPVLELGIGTGRIALPLLEGGLEVHGIDASEGMIEKLQAKPRGGQIPVTIGDFADFDLRGEYSLVFVVFNTFFALLSQESQVSCMASVARHLAPGGLFVLEAFVPDISRFDRGQRTETLRVDADHVRMEATRHDPATQRVYSQHVLISDGNVQLYPVQLRYAWPSELDLMARLAGMRLRERWSDWERRPFDSSSGRHISVYELAG
jgi:SAM-dependent methyltransferase